MQPVSQPAPPADLRSHTRGHASTGRGQPDASLAALVGQPSQALEQLFRAARWQGSPQLAGHPRGRMLAVPGLDGGLVARALAGYARSSLMLWEGKSFRASGSAGQGEGTNRLRLGRRSSAFRFRTYATASLVDGQPALAIDYDLAENPRLVRKVYDELRPLQEGLYLGRGMLRTGSGPRLLVWFALDATRPDAALPF